MPSPSPTPGVTMLLTCADDAPAEATSVVADALGARAVAVGPQPGRTQVDGLLADAGRLVVAGTDADLAAVLLRLLRRERLDLPVAFLPDAASDAAAVWGLPTAPRDALAVAAGGAPRAVPLVRDDGGGVLVGAHRVGAFLGEVWCDERLVHRGDASSLVVRPDPRVTTTSAGGDGGGGVRRGGGVGGGGVRGGGVGGVGAVGGVRVAVAGPRRLGGLRAGRSRDAAGRAVQLGCRPVEVRRDCGVADPRPVGRRSWYRHSEDWRLVLP